MIQIIKLKSTYHGAWAMTEIDFHTILGIPAGQNNPESRPRSRRDASTKLSTGNMRRKPYSIVLLF